MAHRRIHELLPRGALTIFLTIAAGCSLAQVSPLGLQPSEQPKNRYLPGDPSVFSEGGQTVSAPAAAPTTLPADPAPAVPPPLFLAMQRAGSYYERGLLEMRRGNTDQAEWEFDAALETLLNSDQNGGLLPRLMSRDLRSPIPLHTWLSRPTISPQDLTLGSAPPPNPDEATQEAPALLSPEDLNAITKEQAEYAAPVPEPDVKKYDFPIVFNEQVRIFLEYFQTRKWGVITRAFERASRYLPMMRRTFRENELPEELLNLAFIESAVNPWATSRVKAAGIWQFMTSTARLYGMKVSWWVDERRDPEKSTRAAAEYLKNLYRMFDSWPLALAAYNAGEGTVQRAIDRQRTRNFWALRLPKETQLFVPAFMAMTIISKEPERYGFSPPPEEPLQIDTVVLSQPAGFRSLARAARTSVDQLCELNPELIRLSTPPDTLQYTLRIPAGLRADFLEEFARIPPAERVAWVSHRVRKGETTHAIARRYGVSLQAVLDMNGLTKRHALKPGGTVLVPALSSAGQGRAGEARDTRQGDRRKAVTRYKVKPGETLAQVAQLHGVSIADLRRWNGLSGKAGLRPGQTVKVFASAEATRTTVREEGPGEAPSKVPRPALPKRYVVKKGDTLSSIAQAHGVSLGDLRRWNGLSGKATLQPGQKLRLGES